MQPKLIRTFDLDENEFKNHNMSFYTTDNDWITDEIKFSHL